MIDDLRLLASTDAAEALAAMCRLAYARGLVVGLSGNGSVRRPGGYLCTPSGACLGAVVAGELVACDADGRTDRASAPPTSEWGVHARLYAASPEARAVLHTHSPAATAFALAGRPVDPPTPEAEHVLGRVPCLPYLPPASEALAAAVAEAAAGGARGVLLARHGVFTWGRDPREAFVRAEVLEATCALLLRSSAVPGAPGAAPADGAAPPPAGGRAPTARRGLPPPLVWDGAALAILDQRRLPAAEEYVTCRSVEQVVEAIRSLAVRGAPAIGVAAAYGVALAVRQSGGDRARLRELAAQLGGARPTAVNLRRGVALALDAAEAAAAAGSEAMARAAVAAADALRAREAAVCEAIAAAGADLLPPGGWVLTHCHTGSLATGGVGTALGAIAEAHRRGRVPGVYACETRPLLQGARLTAWECMRRGIPCRLLADAAAGWAMASGRVAAVLVGADRIAANGDVANKVGTYALAVLAARHGIPFLVLAPWSSVDLELPSGGAIGLEERDPAEVLRPWAPAGASAWNPAFDVTPGSLVSAIVTEKGVYRRPYALAGEGRGATIPEGATTGA